jgi:hypothetical protein
MVGSFEIGKAMGFSLYDPHRFSETAPHRYRTAAHRAAFQICSKQSVRVDRWCAARREQTGARGFGPVSYRNSRLTFAAHHQRDFMVVIVRVIGKAVAA